MDEKGMNANEQEFEEQYQKFKKDRDMITDIETDYGKLVSDVLVFISQRHITEEGDKSFMLSILFKAIREIITSRIWDGESKRALLYEALDQFNICIEPITVEGKAEEEYLKYREEVITLMAKIVALKV